MVPQERPEAVRISFYDKATDGPVMSPTALQDGIGARINTGTGPDSGVVCYQVASALIAETDSVCGGSWWTGLFRRDLHSA
jgi:hypothetical protein